VPADERSADQDPQGGLTRRRFLIGSGLVAAAALAFGGAAAREPPLHDWLARVTGEGASVGSAPTHKGVTLVSSTLRSRTVAGPVDYGIAWPPGSEPGKPLPVVYALPGRGGGPPMGFADFVADAVEHGWVPPFAVAGIDGGSSYWHRRSSGEDRLAMLFQEFMPLCRERYQLGGSRRRRALIGWSMGGYGALLAAETHPELFTAVVACSPAVWTSYQAMKLGPGDAFDSPADFAAHDVIAGAARLAHLQVRIDCGRSDPFWGYVTHLKAALTRPAAGVYEPGGHDAATFRTVAPAEVAFLGKAFA